MCAQPGLHHNMSNIQHDAASLKHTHTHISWLWHITYTIKFPAGKIAFQNWYNERARMRAIEETPKIPLSVRQ